MTAAVTKYNAATVIGKQTLLFIMNSGFVFDQSKLTETNDCKDQFGVKLLDRLRQFDEMKKIIALQKRHDDGSLNEGSKMPIYTHQGMAISTATKFKNIRKKSITRAINT